MLHLVPTECMFYCDLSGPACSKTNPRIKINQGNNFSSIKMLSTAYVLCSLRLLMLKTEGQTLQREHLAEKK